MIQRKGEKSVMQYILYFVLVLCGLIFVRNRFLEGTLLVLDILLIGFIHGGVDYPVYRLIYEQANFSYIAGGDIEIGFLYLCAFSRDVLHFSFETFYFIIGTASILLIYSVARRYTKNRAMFLALFSLFPLLISIIQIRNLLSFSIVFWGVGYLESYLENKKIANLIKYGVCVLVAATIHTSALYFFVFYLFLIKDDKKLFSIVLVWCVAGRFLILPIGLRIAHNFVRYTVYLRDLRGIMTQICSFAVLVVNYILARMMYSCVKLYVNRHREQRLSKYDERSIQFAQLVMKINIIAFTSWPFFALTLETMRFVRYLMLFNYILYSIPTRMRANVRLQYLLRFGISIMACFFMWFYGIHGILVNTVFLPIFESNQFFRLFY